MEQKENIKLIGTKELFYELVKLNKRVSYLEQYLGNIDSSLFEYQDRIKDIEKFLQTKYNYE